MDDNRLSAQTEEREKPDEGAMAAWEEIEDGRYMPRRVRGSCHGRELG